MIAINLFKRSLNFFRSKKKQSYDFDKSNPLGAGGERVDFIYSTNLMLDKLDVYQINHYRRYEFASQQIHNDVILGDFACGSGYGSAMLSEKASKVIGMDIDEKVIDTIKIRYRHLNNVEYVCQNLLDLSFYETFDNIISFETLEHFDENDINVLLRKFSNGLKKNGRLIFSTPYMQEDDESARNLGFHKTFYINENTINDWLLKSGLKAVSFNYQNYKTHTILKDLAEKDFIICIAQKQE